MTQLLQDFLSKRMLKYTEYYDLSFLSSIRAGGIARVAVFPANRAELVALLVFLTDNKIPYIVVGGLTNTLIATDMYTSVVVSTKNVREIAYNNGVFTADAGMSLASLMVYAARASYGGAEQLWLIPGTVGAALVGNAGAHGAQMADIVLSADVFSPTTRTVEHLDARDMRFGYRHSLFKSAADLTVLSVSVRLYHDSGEAISGRRRHFAQIRRAAQPTNLPSLGSVFKKADGVSAGFYIERAGLKGYRIGGAEISSRHAGFIVNCGGATWRDILALVSLSERCVAERFGIYLEPEIGILR